MFAMLRKVALIVVACAAPARAQSDAYWEIRPMAGVSLPTGSHRHAFGNVGFLGAQTSIRVTPAFDMVGSFAWQVSTAKYPVPDNRANVLVYNVGIERLFRPARPGADVFVPFAGGGVGGRSYDYRSSRLQSAGCIAGYGNAGAMYERRRTTARLEVRDNVFCFKSPLAPFSEATRNEVSISIGAGVRF